MQQNYEIKYLLTRLQKKKHVCRQYRKCVIIEVQLRRRALSLPALIEQLPHSPVLALHFYNAAMEDSFFNADRLTLFLLGTDMDHVGPKPTPIRDYGPDILAQFLGL